MFRIVVLLEGPPASQSHRPSGQILLKPVNGSIKLAFYNLDPASNFTVDMVFFGSYAEPFLLHTWCIVLHVIAQPIIFSVTTDWRSFRAALGSWATLTNRATDQLSDRLVGNLARAPPRGQLMMD